MEEKCFSPGCLRQADYICSCSTPKVLSCENHLSWHINSKKKIDHSTRKVDSTIETELKECQLCIKKPSRYLCICRGLGVKLCPDCFELHSIQNPGRHVKEPVEASEFIKEERDILFYTERRDQIDGILKVVKDNLKDIQAKEELFRMLNTRVLEKMKKWYEEKSIKINQVKKALKQFEEEILKCKYRKDISSHWINNYLKERDYSKIFKTVKMEFNEESVEQMMKVLCTIDQDHLLVSHTDINKPEILIPSIEKDIGALYSRVQSTLTDHGSRMIPKLVTLYTKALEPSKIESIIQIELANCMLGASGARYLSIVLPVLPQLNYLNLCSNAIGPIGAKELSSGLTQCKTITTLLLAWNKLENKGIENLSEGISALPSLKVLQLSWNEISEQGAQFLARALISCDKLEKLDLWNNPLGADGMRNLVLALPYLAKLKVLDLNKTELGPEGGEVLALALPKLQELTNLGVANNNFGDLGIRSISMAIASNKKLQIIDVARNSFKGDGTVAIQEAMQKMQKESTVIVTGNGLSREDRSKLNNTASSNSLRLSFG
jgi:hypothetical protein